MSWCLCLSLSVCVSCYICVPLCLCCVCLPYVLCNDADEQARPMDLLTSLPCSTSPAGWVDTPTNNTLNSSAERRVLHGSMQCSAAWIHALHNHMHIHLSGSRRLCGTPAWPLLVIAAHCCCSVPALWLMQHVAHHAAVAPAVVYLCNHCSLFVLVVNPWPAVLPPLVGFWWLRHGCV